MKIILFLILIILSIISLIILRNFTIKPVFKNITKTLAMFFIIVSIIAIVAQIGLYTIAKAHGLESIDTKPSLVWSNIKQTPREDVLPDDLAGSIIVYYRFNCPACHVIWDDLSPIKQENKNIYFISSRSIQGQKIIKDYPVKSVPSAVYIYQNNKDFVKKELITESNGKYIFNQEAFDRLLLLQEENR